MIIFEQNRKPTFNAIFQLDGQIRPKKMSLKHKTKVIEKKWRLKKDLIITKLFKRKYRC